MLPSLKVEVLTRTLPKQQDANSSVNSPELTVNPVRRKASWAKFTVLDMCVGVRWDRAGRRGFTLSMRIIMCDRISESTVVLSI